MLYTMTQVKYHVLPSSHIFAEFKLLLEAIHLDADEHIPLGAGAVMTSCIIVYGPPHQGDLGPHP